MTEQTACATVERPVATLPGWGGLAILVAAHVAGVWLLVSGLAGSGEPAPAPVVAGGMMLVAALVGWNGLFVVQPNQAEVLLLFGRYLGSVKQPGWYFANPLVSKRKLSLRFRNFNSAQLKVNDADGNPIEIAAVVVWRVVDTARAAFDVENYTQFVEVQSETAVRHLASEYPYDDAQHPGQPSLRHSADEVAAVLRRELQVRLDVAGIEVVEARLSHLAYSPEIAPAMLQRQQATAIIAARQKIVEGAVSMVEMALDMLNQKKMVDFTPEQKAAMVANLLVVLTSDRAVHPVVPMGQHG